MNVRLCIMTKELARQYFSRFELDPMLFMDLSQYQPYVYSPEKSDAVLTGISRSDVYFWQ